MNKIRVLLVSLYPSILLAFLNFFSTDPLISPDVSSYDDYNKHKLNYHTVILDDDSLGKNEFEILNDILNSDSNYKKIIYTNSSNIKYLKLIDSMSSNGIVSKSSGLETLKEAIFKTEDRTKYYSKLIDNLIRHRKVYTQKLNLLTDREKEILDFMKQGFTNREISEMLYLSVKTIEAHKENIKAKIGVSSVKELHKYFTEIES